MIPSVDSEIIALALINYHKLSSIPLLLQHTSYWSDVLNICLD